MTAIGVMHQAYCATVSVPSELSVIGFDQHPLVAVRSSPANHIEMSQSGTRRLAFHALLQDVSATRQHHTGTEYVLKTNLGSAIPKR